MGRADGGVRRHGRDIGRQGDERARAGGAGAGGRDINDRRHFIGEEFAHDFLRGFQQPAGSVKLNNQARFPVRRRLVQGARNVGGGGGTDGPLHLDQPHLAGVERRRRRHEGRRPTCRQRNAKKVKAHI